MTAEERSRQYTLVVDDPFEEEKEQQVFIDPEKSATINYLRHWDDDEAEFVLGGENEEVKQPLKRKETPGRKRPESYVYSDIPVEYRKPRMDKSRRRTRAAPTQAVPKRIRF